MGYRFYGLYYTCEIINLASSSDVMYNDAAAKEFVFCCALENFTWIIIFIIYLISLVVCFVLFFRSRSTRNLVWLQSNPKTCLKCCAYALCIRSSIFALGGFYFCFCCGLLRRCKNDFVKSILFEVKQMIEKCVALSSYSSLYVASNSWFHREIHVACIFSESNITLVFHISRRTRLCNMLCIHSQTICIVKVQIMVIPKTAKQTEL